MRHLSVGLTESLKSLNDEGIEEVRQVSRHVYAVPAPREVAVSSSASLKLGRFIHDIQESIEDLHGIKMHGTLISLRAYLLLSLYLLPFIFTLNMAYNLDGDPHWLICMLNVIPGLVLFSLYNLHEL